MELMKFWQAIANRASQDSTRTPTLHTLCKLYGLILSSNETMVRVRKKGGTNTTTASGKITTTLPRPQDADSKLFPITSSYLYFNANPDASSSLLKLPLELRFQIYEEALLAHLPKSFTVRPNLSAGCHSSCNIKGPKSPSIALFRVCKQVRAEAIQYFYGRLKFKVTDDPYCVVQSRKLGRDNGAFSASSIVDLKPFLTGLSPWSCANVRHLKICMTRSRFLNDNYTYGKSSSGTRFLAEALELLAHYNGLRCIEIELNTVNNFKLFMACESILEQLRKFNGLQKARIRSPDEKMLDQKSIDEARELEEYLKKSPPGLPKEVKAFFSSNDPNESDAARQAKTCLLGAVQMMQKRQDAQSRHTALKIRLQSIENEYKDIQQSLEKTEVELSQYDTSLAGLNTFAASTPS